MISHFWNLCRACPALDVDKLHSEYRSTYRWHEYTPKQQQVVRKPPLPNSGMGIDGSDFPRKKKHPDQAYRSHDFFDPTAVAHETRASRQAERENSAMQRRSQSEGPVKRNPLFQSEYRLQFATKKGGRERSYEKDEIRPQEPKPVVSYPPPAQSSSWNRRQASLRSREPREEPEPREPKKSISMGQIQPTGHPPSSAQILTGLARDTKEMNGNTDMVDGREGGFISATASPAHRREYKSEYKNKFRPFSQYEYMGEGRYYNTTNSPPSEVDGPSSLVPFNKMERLEGEPWYKEVQELRKMANDYKCRGWGTDLVPPHMSEIYSLHEQASKRESLSALALAISTPRSLKKEDKERENQRKVSPAPLRLARPKTAPPKSKKASSNSSRPESAQASPLPRTDKENTAPTPGENKRMVSKPGSKAVSRDTSRPPSAIENHMDYFREPVVKSPPEPTRVKSPEQLLMRSPDPINWTVPLDTGKTFSVTQSVRDSDSARNSPMSDHSSHFDSVTGTAINLGLHSVNEKGSLHYPKVSALAREAKELQGKSNHHHRDDHSNEVKREGRPTNGADTGAINGAHESANAPTATKVPQPKCLEDPNFSFDEPAKVPAPAPPAGEKEEAVRSTAPAAVNGAENGEKETLNDISSMKLPKPAPTSSIPVPVSGASSSGGKAAAPDAGSTPTAAPASTASSIPVPVKTTPKKPSYRVLEDPDLESPRPMGTPYKVLEDPSMMTASIYEPSRDSGSGALGKI